MISFFFLAILEEEHDRVVNQGFSGPGGVTWSVVEVVIIGGFGWMVGTAVDWEERVFDEMAEADSASPGKSGCECPREVS